MMQAPVVAAGFQPAGELRQVGNLPPPQQFLADEARQGQSPARHIARAPSIITVREVRMNNGHAKTLRLVCPHDCPDTCGMLVTVEDGKATKLRGDPDHPFTRGFLCQKVTRYLDRVYH